MTAALVVALAGLSGCGQGGTSPASSAAPSPAGSAAAQPVTTPSTRDRPTPTARPSASVRPGREALDPGDGYVLTATVDEVEVHDSPGGEVAHALPNPRDTGAPLTFLLADDPGRGWYEVMVPVRPNGTTGFVRAQDVDVARVPYRLVMSTADNELTLYESGEVLRTMSAASGTGDTPTPLGLFYLTELLEPTNAGYGPYAYGLSGYSEVLTSFGGGPGQIGLHGTDDAGSVGQAVSNGCIRLSDDDITYLAELLPLGTPVEIV